MLSYQDSQVPRRPGPQGSDCRDQLPPLGLGHQKQGFKIMNTRKLKHGPGGAGVSECGGGIRGAETRPAGQEASSSRCWCLWGRAMMEILPRVLEKPVSWVPRLLREGTAWAGVKWGCRGEAPKSRRQAGRNESPSPPSATPCRLLPQCPGGGTRGSL